MGKSLPTYSCEEIRDSPHRQYFFFDTDEQRISGIGCFILVEFPKIASSRETHV